MPLGLIFPYTYRALYTVSDFSMLSLSLCLIMSFGYEKNTIYMCIWRHDTVNDMMWQWAVFQSAFVKASCEWYYLIFKYNIKYVKSTKCGSFTCECRESFMYMWLGLLICKMLLSLAIIQWRCINTEGKERFVSVQTSRGLWGRKMEKEWWDRRGREMTSSESHTKKAFEVTGADLKQETSTSARRSHQRCMAAWQILRMFCWSWWRSSPSVEAAVAEKCFFFSRWKLWMLCPGGSRISVGFRVIQDDDFSPTWLQLRMVPLLTDYLFHHKRQVFSKFYSLHKQKMKKQNKLRS